MQAKHSLEFARAPAVWSMYPKIMMSRKPSLVPDGGAVPRIESRLSKVAIDRKHLAAYSEICGAAAGATLPIAYPHVLAMPLHLAMLGAEAFPVKLFGLVHVQNRIAMRQPLSAEEPAEIRAWVEGHRETERGQEFDLHTDYVVAGEALWEETCTFLARKKPAPGAAKPPWPAPTTCPGCRGDEVQQFSRAGGTGAALWNDLRRRQSDPHERPDRARLRIPARHRAWHVVAGTAGVGFRSRAVQRRLRAVCDLQTTHLHAGLADAAALGRSKTARASRCATGRARSRISSEP